MLSLVNGIFALLIWNRATKKLFLARDKLGIKPLYWAKVNGQIVASSELSAVKALIPELTLRAEAESEFLNLRGWIDDLTVYKEIETFPKASYFFDGSLVRYHELVLEGSSSDKEFEEVLEYAVKLETVSSRHVPGGLLSGGVDSAVLYALTGVENSWTAGTREFNEFGGADAISSYLGRRQSEKIVIDNESDFQSLGRELLIQKSEPIGVPNEILLARTFQIASCKSRVIFSGEGADELMAGYDRVFSWAAGKREFDLRDFASRYSYSSEPDLEVFDRALEPIRKLTSEPFEIVTAFFLNQHLPVLLRRVDFASMRSGVEVRVPYLNDLLVEKFAFSPHNWKKRGGITKYPLRAFAAKIIGHSNAFREKVGFPVSFSKHSQTVDRQENYESWLRARWEEFEKWSAH